MDRLYVVFLPGIPSQGDAVKARHYANVFVPPGALDGPNLLYYADLVISSGGTMNREAAILSTPNYSLFKGKLAAVDRYLIDKGLMKYIDSAEKISDISICKKTQQKMMNKSGDRVEEIADLMVN